MRLLSGLLKPARLSTPLAPRTLPTLEALEERTVLSTSSIVSNFNGNSIAGGNYLWFSSVFKPSGVGSSPVTIDVTDQHVTFATKDGASYDVAVPDSVITLSPTTTAAAATTTFDAGSNRWVTNLPSRFSGNGFLGGASFQVPSGGLPGGINPVTWTANFTTDTAGVSLNWQWAAAVYKGTGFSSDPSALGVKPLDGATAAYANSDHAGTPEAFRDYVLGGARGGGGSNFTGSYSATGHVTPEVANARVSGFVYADTDLNGSFNPTGGDFGLEGVTVTLTDGQGHTRTATTDKNGFYQFTGLGAGTYTLIEGDEPAALGFSHELASVGTVGGNTDGQPAVAQISQVQLNTGDQGVNYNFGEVLNSGQPT
jgi:SdrD B-like domain